MRRFVPSFVLGLGALTFIPASGALAAVSLALAGNGSAHTGTSTIVNLALGPNTFDVGVELISTSGATNDLPISLAYKLEQASGNTIPGGYFSLVGADLTTNISAPNRFSDAITTDPTVDAMGTSGAGDPLHPISSFLLGGNINRNFNATLTGLGNNYPNGTGTFSPNLIGTYTLKVAPNTPVGVYKIGINYASAPNDYAYVVNAAQGSYADAAFVAPPSNPNGLTQTFTVTVVVPEPSSALLVAIGAAAWSLRRRRPATVSV